MLTLSRLEILANYTKSACWLDISIGIYVVNAETTLTLFTQATHLLGCLSVSN